MTLQGTPGSNEVGSLSQQSDQVLPLDMTNKDQSPDLLDSLSSFPFLYTLLFPNHAPVTGSPFSFPFLYTLLCPHHPAFSSIMPSDNSKSVEGNPQLELATEESNLDSDTDQFSSTDIKLAAVEKAIEQHIAAGEHQRTYEVVGLITVCFGSDNDTIIDSEAMKTCFNSHFMPSFAYTLRISNRHDCRLTFRHELQSVLEEWFTKPCRRLQRCLRGLIIFHYAEHGKCTVSDPKNLLLHSGNPNRNSKYSIEFSTIKNLFSQPDVGLDGADILYTLDCCYAAHAVKEGFTSTIECLAATTTLTNARPTTDGNTTFTQALVKELSEWDKNTIPSVANIYKQLLKKRKKALPYWHITSGVDSIILPLKGTIATQPPRNNTSDDDDKIDLNLCITLTPNLEDPTIQELFRKIENISRYFDISVLEIQKRMCKGQAPNGMPLRFSDV